MEVAGISTLTCFFVNQEEEEEEEGGSISTILTSLGSKVHVSCSLLLVPAIVMSNTTNKPIDANKPQESHFSLFPK